MKVFISLVFLVQIISTGSAIELVPVREATLESFNSSLKQSSEIQTLSLKRDQRFKSVFNRLKNLNRNKKQAFPYSDIREKRRISENQRMPPRNHQNLQRLVTVKQTKPPPNRNRLPPPPP